MKQNIPTPVAAVIAVLVLAVALYFVFAKAGDRSAGKQSIIDAQQRYHAANPGGSPSPNTGSKSGQ